MVLGGHGDTWCRSLSYCTINGVPVKQLDRRRTSSTRSSTRTRNGGGEIVKLMGTSAYYAPASAAIAMAEAYLTTRSACCPCAAYLDGEYGYKDLYLGVPVVIGADGVEKIVAIELTADEKAMLDKSRRRRSAKLIEAAQEALRTRPREDPRVPGQGALPEVRRADPQGHPGASPSTRPRRPRRR